MANPARLSAFAALLEYGLSKVFKDTLPTHPLLYKPWLKERKAKEWIEDELMTTGFGAMPEKTVGGVFSLDKPFITDPKDHTLKAYGLAFSIEYELMRWDRYQVFVNVTKKLTRSGVDRKNLLAFSILNNSMNSGAGAEYKTYASEILCTTAHALQRGGTAKNAPSAAVGVSYLGMQEAITDFQLLPNEDGLFIRLSPKHVICAPAKVWVAETVLGSQYRHDNANQEKNTLKGQLEGPITAPYLTNENYWWVTAGPSTLLDEAGISLDIGDDLEFRRDYQISTWNRTYSMYGSFRPRVFHWYGTWGTTGA
jgi:hypothetical protein